MSWGDPSEYAGRGADSSGAEAVGQDAAAVQSMQAWRSPDRPPHAQLRRLHARPAAKPRVVGEQGQSTHALLWARAILRATTLPAQRHGRPFGSDLDSVPPSDIGG